jgi:hypothetical protein
MLHLKIILNSYKSMDVKVQNEGLMEKIMDLYFQGCKSVTMWLVYRFLDIEIIWDLKSMHFKKNKISHLCV